MPKIKLTPENYYTPETDREYLSFSVFKNFATCEARALAELNGEWQRQESKALLVGNYVHSYFEGPEAHQKWLEQKMADGRTHAQATMTKGTKNTPPHLRAEYKMADEMIEALEKQRAFQQFYVPGQKEVIVTGELFGRPWKGKIDSLTLEQNYFFDLKTVDDFTNLFYNPETRGKENFAVNRGYCTQMAIYQELLRQTFGKTCFPYMIAVTKQTPPDMELGKFDPDGPSGELMAEGLYQIEQRQEHVWAVMEGKVAPKECGHCDYCRAHKVLDHFVDVTEIGVD